MNPAEWRCPCAWPGPFPHTLPPKRSACCPGEAPHTSSVPAFLGGVYGCRRPRSSWNMDLPTEGFTMHLLVPCLLKPRLSPQHSCPPWSSGSGATWSPSAVCRARSASLFGLHVSLPSPAGWLSVVFFLRLGNSFQPGLSLGKP